MCQLHYLTFRSIVMRKRIAFFNPHLSSVQQSWRTRSISFHLAFVVWFFTTVWKQLLQYPGLQVPRAARLIFIQVLISLPWTQSAFGTRLNWQHWVLNFIWGQGLLLVNKWLVLGKYWKTSSFFFFFNSYQDKKLNLGFWSLEADLLSY